MVTVISERESGALITTVEYRGRRFDIAVGTLLGQGQGDVATYWAEITEILADTTAAWDGDDTPRETSEEAYEAAVAAIISTVDDDAANRR